MSNDSSSTTHLTLDKCSKGEKLRVRDIFPEPTFGKQDEHVTLRLKELGFLPGASIEIIGYGFLGRDPLAVKVNGTKFALRTTEASKIAVEHR